MSNEKQETIADIAAQMRGLADGMEKRGLYDLRECGTDYLRALADLIEAAAEREMADEKRISDAVIQSLRDKKLEMNKEIVEKDADIVNLRALVKEMADELSKFHAWEETRALVAKAREA